MADERWLMPPGLAGGGTALPDPISEPGAATEPRSRRRRRPRGELPPVETTPPAAPGETPRVWDADPELHAAAAAERKRAAEAAAKPPPCPIVALGHLRGNYFFLSPSGQFVQFNFRELSGVGGLLSLFDGDTAYLKAVWRRFDRDGDPMDDFNAKAATAGLIRRCADAGIWNPETPVRAYGVWRARDRAALIAHSGNLLSFSDGETMSAGRRIAGAIYPALASVAAPSAEPATMRMVRELRQDFRLWRYAPLGNGLDKGPAGLAADLLYCSSSLALLGAGPIWRVHTLIKAVHGSGKSALIEFLAAILGAQAVVMNNFTEAGLRQSLANEARAGLLDEAEGDAAGLRMAQVIEVIRQMSGGTGVQGVRGSGDGTARHFQIAGCVFLACINMPPLLPQDQSRILVLEMLTAVKENESEARSAIARAEMSSPAFRARALAGWPRFQRNLPLLKQALLDLGASSRQGDQLAAVLAAGAMMSDDEPIDAADARHLAESVVPLLDRMRADEGDQSDARRCWLMLMSQPARHWRAGDDQTIASLLRLAQDQTAGVAARQTLDRNYGMRLVTSGATASMPEAPCLYVANQHQFLRELYQGTPWRESTWSPSLARLDDASASANSVRIGGLKQRAVAIPFKHLPRNIDDHDTPEE